jgi:hypothetical protein
MKRMLVVLAAACACTAGQAQAHVQHAQGSKALQLQARITHDRGVIRSVDRQSVRVGSAMFIEYRLWRIRQWHARDLAKARAELVQSVLPRWWLNAAMCVHRGEGAFNANTGNGFEGGMQFINSTWLASGGGRFASHAYLATPYQQMLVAYWLWKRSGWSPWPTTARACGLL